MTTTRSETEFIPLGKQSFRFKCYPGISCFTECCADLNLILTPYDILRLKNRLQIPSDVFIDDYTEPKLDEAYRFPVVRLLMKNDERRACPFVTPEGCTVYEDRPGACRIYPLGRAAMSLGEGAREKFFLVKESHCMGFQEDREWTSAEWMSGEGVDEYNRMNDPWLGILTSRMDLGSQTELDRKISMFYMASYNLDKFRDFVFKSPFLSRFEVDEETTKKIASDDVALMHFAFDWLWFALFGKDTMKVKK